MGFMDRVLGKKATPPHGAVVAPAAGNYRVQVLLPHAPRLDPRAIHAHLRTWRADVDLIGDNANVFGLAIPTGEPMPIFAHVMAAPADAYGEALRDALTWSQTFRDRHAAVARANASIVVATAFDRRRNRAVQLLSLLAVLDTVLVSLDDELADAAVVHWMPAQSLLPLERYRMLRQELGPSGPAVNVRIAKVGGTAGEMFGDTLGLAALGLPDLQTRFAADRDPNEIAMRLMHLAKALFMDQDLDVAVQPAPYLAPPERDTLTAHV
jgi:hypothetical protein